MLFWITRESEFPIHSVAHEDAISFANSLPYLRNTYYFSLVPCKRKSTSSIIKK